MTEQERIELVAEFWDAPGEAYFPREYVAAFLRCSESRLMRDAAMGTGIPYTRFANRALYQKRDVLDFLAANRQETARRSSAAQPMLRHQVYA